MLATGCRSHRADDAKSGPEQIYAKAQKAIRNGSYAEAVKQLERAVELKPVDPTINDHLGDAYWRVGRTLEAKFQWSHARDLKPEPEDLPKIEAKIANGLPEDTSSAASADKKKEDGKGG